MMSIRRHAARASALRLGIHIRPMTMDWYIVDEIERRDVYGLRRMTLPVAPCVIDIGCQVGVFMAAVLQRWPDASVFGFELDPSNAGLAGENMRGRASVTNVAIVGDRVPSGYDRSSVNSGGHALRFDGPQASASMPTMTLANAIATTRCHVVDLLKIDIEGAEYDVLARAARDGALARVHRIVMEWHEFTPEQRVGTLVAMLSRSGFAVTSTRETRRQGTITAIRV